MRALPIPPARRARLSGYVKGAGPPLAWEWVDERMPRARTYWIGVHSDGFPCVRPVWGLWWPPRVVFSTGGALVRHIQRDDRVQVSVELGDDVVLVEGRVAALAEGDAERWAHEYNAKYAWDMPASTKDVWIVTPQRVLAWTCDNSGRDRGQSFDASATEWRFATAEVD